VSAFPYVRLVCCDVCGRAVPEPDLSPVMLDHSRVVNGYWRASRVVYVCDRHDIGGDCASTQRPKRPPQETLF